MLTTEEKESLKALSSRQLCLLLNVISGLKLYNLPPLGVGVGSLGVLDFSHSSTSVILGNKRSIHLKSTGLWKAVQQGGYLLSDLL